MKEYSLALASLLLCCAINAQSYKEPHRPQIHFSPEAHWMNDPNGMVYANGTYHLFYQYYPGATVWGPMHWGHATSSDMISWKNEPVALYPDSLGYIFSGSAVLDVNNTSGFGKNGKAPLVAIFTHHDPKGEKAGTSTYQTQSIAYSLDDAKTWTKYSGNPVLKNPGIKDFRDPKVNWYEAGKKWIMTLATLDRITFYSSTNLKDWKKESEFGKTLGAHGGVWECPDLFPLKHNGEDIWVLIVNINPGGPNKGSATQYFTGKFDGNTFTTDQKGTKWLDYGPDEYAGITWGNTGDRKVFYGWMSNWQYANLVPTEKWRSAMTIPRELKIEKIGNDYLVASVPVKELRRIESTVTKSYFSNLEFSAGPSKLSFTADKIESFSVTLANDAGEHVIIGYDKASNNYFIDRSKSGKVSFEKGFAARHVAPRFATTPAMDLTLVIDDASVELFADNGLTVMTEIFFPNKPYSKLVFKGDALKVKAVNYSKLKSIW
jgi:fructan beta-fructosidase